VRLIFFIIVLFSLPVFAEEPKQSFDDWLVQFKQNALAKGISQEVIDDAFGNLTMPSDTILEQDTKQPENTRTFSEYQEGILSEKRIAAAKDNLHSHRKMLRKIETKYHVPPSVLLALWGLESNFGKRQGEDSVVESLATLAYDGRRRQFFSDELMDALQIMQSEDIKAEDLTGSWAGAMGQTQFMPSSFIKFAVDFNHDGKKDIWHSDADALASIANYLHSKGWNPKYGWGIEVSLPESEDMDEWINDKDKKSMKEWSELGFTRTNGKRLPKINIPARLVIPDDESAAFLVFPNYDVIMDWNHSIYFATSIGLLADKIGKK
jgi:membrane-bound lytic murein transglycosylase B